MSGNELPSNMGKKIADALKKQNKPSGGESELEISENESMEALHSQDVISISHNEMHDSLEDKHTGFSSIIPSDEDDDDSDSSYDELDDLYEAPTIEGVEQESEEYTPVFKMESGDVSDNPDFKLTIDSEDDTEEFEMPNNINVLKRLISQLPGGVSKQVGAQIIRQTIEALGIPMKSVLQDAQKVRDCLNSSIKDCNFTIQEYKSNIRNLEKQNLNYQKQLTKLNDIIGLFVYNDK